MKARGILLILICTLVLGGSGSVFAADTTASSWDLVTSIQNRYNSILDAQYARLVVIKKIVLGDAGTFRRFKALLVDFLDVRRIIDSGLTSSISAVEATRAKIRTIKCVKVKRIEKVIGISAKCFRGYKK